MCKIIYANQLNDKNKTLLAYYLLNTSIGVKVYYYEKKLESFKKKHYRIFVDKKNADVSKQRIILTGSHLKQKGL